MIIKEASPTLPEWGRPQVGIPHRLAAALANSHHHKCRNNAAQGREGSGEGGGWRDALTHAPRCPMCFAPS